MRSNENALHTRPLLLRCRPPVTALHSHRKNRSCRLVGHACFECWHDALLLPLQTTARVWDALLLEGSKVMLRVALAIFSRYENTICNSSYPSQLKKVSTNSGTQLGPNGSLGGMPACMGMLHRFLASMCLLCSNMCCSASRLTLYLQLAAAVLPTQTPAVPDNTRRAPQVLEARMSRVFDADALMSVAFKGVGSMPNSSIQLLRQRALQDIHEQQLEHQRRLAALLGKAQLL